MTARIGPCDDCGNETATLNCNTVSNPYMLCGRCQYAHLGDIDTGQGWDAPSSNARLTILNSQVWIMSNDRLVSVKAEDLPEMITALQVAQARQQAAKGVQNNGV